MDWRDGPIRQREAGWYSSCAIQACQPLSAPFHGCQQTPQNPTPLQGRKLSSILIPLNRTTQRDSPANFFAGEKEKRDSLWSPNNAILGIMRPACTNTMCDGVCSRDKSRANSNGKAVWIQSCVCVSVCTQMVGVYQLSSLGQTFRKYLRISKPETGFVTNILEFSWNFNYLQPDFRNLFPGQNGKIRGQTQSHTTDSRRNLSQISRTWRPSLNMKAQVLIHAREPNNELVVNAKQKNGWLLPVCWLFPYHCFALFCVFFPLPFSLQSPQMLLKGQTAALSALVTQKTFKTGRVTLSAGSFYSSFARSHIK